MIADVSINLKKIATALALFISLTGCSRIAGKEEVQDQKPTALVEEISTLATEEGLLIDNGVEYEPLSEDPFKDYKDAKLIIDYYVTEGWSTHDRNSYEIIVVDDHISFGYDSPQSDSHKATHFEMKEALTLSDAKEIAGLLKKADIKQGRIGIPKPDATAHKKEVLLLRNGSQRVAGGMFSYTIYEDGTPMEEVKRQEIETRSENTSIKGNYDMLFKYLRSRFKNLDSLVVASSVN